MGVTYYLTLLFSLNQRLLYKSPPQWPIVLQGIWGGLVGSLIDSFLGATVQFSGKAVHFEKHLHLLSCKITDNLIFFSLQHICWTVKKKY